MTKQRRGIADLGEVRIAYEESGLPNANAMLFLHGWMADRAGFRQQISHFEGRYRCLNPDLTGHGESAPADRDYGITYFSETMEEFLDYARVSKAILVGRSLGALIALEMAAVGHIKPAAAILVDPLRSSKAKP